VATAVAANTVTANAVANNAAVATGAAITANAVVASDVLANAAATNTIATNTVAANAVTADAILANAAATDIITGLERTFILCPAYRLTWRALCKGDFETRCRVCSLSGSLSGLAVGRGDQDSGNSTQQQNCVGDSGHGDMTKRDKLPQQLTGKQNETIHIRGEWDVAAAICGYNGGNKFIRQHKCLSVGFR
jgi:hypothetical protein